MIDYKRIKVAKHDYVVKYTTTVVGHIYRLDLEDVPLLSLPQLASYIEQNAKEAQDKSIPQMALSVKVDGWPMNKTYVEKLNALLQQNDEVDECDGGGAGAGDAGGASAGDAGAAADAGDIAGEMAGTSVTDVLGKFEPGKGVMGVGNFMVPVKVKHPLHRWEIANGGSKRKKGKNGKPKKYEYEKGMKVVVSMFEDENDMPTEPLSFSKPDVSGMWEYYENMPEADNDESSYDYHACMHIPSLKSQLQTSSKDLSDAQWFDAERDGEDFQYDGFKKFFKTEDDAIDFALKRLHDEVLAYEDDTRYYASNEEWENEKEWKQAEHEKAIDSLKSKGECYLTDGRYVVWECKVQKV